MAHHHRYFSKSTPANIFENNDDDSSGELKALIAKSDPTGSPRPNAREHGLGLFPFVNYNVHVPLEIPRIPHSEGAILWDNLGALARSKLLDGEGVIQEVPPLVWRIIALILTFVLVWGPSLGFPTFGAIYTQMKTEFGYSDSQLGFLFSVYSLPTIFAVLFAGVLVDRLGINKCLAICIVLFSAGYLLTLGEQYWFLVIGRGLYGLGSECVSVVQDAIVARWYSRDTTVTLSLATAVCMLSYRSSAWVAMTFSPMVYEGFGLEAVLLATVGFVALAAIAGVVLIGVDKRYDAYLQGGEEPSDSSLSCSNLTRLGPVFWLLSLTTFAIYFSVIPFISFSTEFFINKWGITEVEAGWLTGVIYLTATIVLLPGGFIIDKWGHRSTLIAVSTFLPVVAYIILLNTNITPYVGCMMLGATHGLLPAIVFPSVALVVESSLFGTAYGILTCFLNLGLFISPLLLGYIQELTGSTDVSTINNWRLTCLICSSCVAFLLGILVWVVDWKHGSVLETTCVLKLGSDGDTATIVDKKLKSLETRGENKL